MASVSVIRLIPASTVRSTVTAAATTVPIAATTTTTTAAATAVPIAATIATAVPFPIQLPCLRMPLRRILDTSTMPVVELYLTASLFPLVLSTNINPKTIVGVSAERVTTLPSHHYHDFHGHWYDAMPVSSASLLSSISVN